MKFIIKRAKALNNTNKVFLIGCMTIILNACTSLNSEFQCPMKPGMRCESLDQISERVERGEINKYSSRTPSSCGLSGKNSTGCTSCMISKITTQKISQCNSCSSNISMEKPLRYIETVQHVWIAPFEDTEGNYHQESDIYTISKPGYWVGKPPKELVNGEG